MSKFARGNRFSIAEHQERYKEECQRIFELQNRVLSSNEVLSTDEESEEEEDSDIEEMGKNIENMLANKKTSQDLSHEKEEAERRELQRLIMGEDSQDGGDKSAPGKKKKEGEEGAEGDSNSGRILKIYRTFRTPDGKEYVRIETVRKPAIIDTYVRIRQTKDPEFIRKFATALDDQQKEEKRREKRRIQEQLRRLKRNEEREKYGFGTSRKSLSKEGEASTQGRSFLDFDEVPDADDDMSDSETSKKKLKEKRAAARKLKEITMKCGACGQVGHMKTNRSCPFYSGEGSSLPPMAVAMTEEQELQEDDLEEEESLIKVDDTKIVLSKNLIAHAEEVRRKALVLKVPKELMKRKRRIGSDHCDYLAKPEYKAVQRKRTDPLVSLSILLESICQEMKEVEGSELFWTPVNAKQVPDYYKIIQHPMDIQSIRKKVTDKLYSCREDFLADVDQMVKNSIMYNGAAHQLTATAQKMYDLCVQRFNEKEDKLVRIERAINPLLDDNDQVAFEYILQTIIDRLKLIPESFPFHKPVDRKKVKNYYDVIKNPMDLETLEALIKHHKYCTVEHFMSDVDLIRSNSQTYNGPDSLYTKKAEEIVNEAKALMAENEEQLLELEAKIAQTKEAALEAADSESVITGGSVADEMISRPGSSAAQSGHEDSNFMEDEMEQESTLLGRRGVDSGEEEEDSMDVPSTSREGMSTLPTVAEEDENVVDENYDPEEFLLERFKQQQQQDNPQSPSGSGDHENEQSMDVGDAPQEPSEYEERHVEATEEEQQPVVQQQQLEEGEDDDGGLWF